MPGQIKYLAKRNCHRVVRPSAAWEVWSTLLHAEERAVLQFIAEKQIALSQEHSCILHASASVFVSKF